MCTQQKKQCIFKYATDREMLMVKEHVTCASTLFTKLNADEEII